jgi:hypothetical protein
LLIFALAASSCASVGPPAKQALVCPVLPPIPANLMQEPETGKKVRDELFKPPTNATPK